jgi:Di-haem oxidoreductase, putative peroxidase
LAHTALPGDSTKPFVYAGIMVRLGRFELSTSCFGGTRSIHLSYSRTLSLYHGFNRGTLPAGLHGGTQIRKPSHSFGRDRRKTIPSLGDFLQHDVGTGDGIVQNGPPDTQYKVRTMPLWGLRTRTQFMHDASMGTYSEAVARHRNEAANAVSQFRGLSPAQKQLLYQFLGSL